MEQKPGRREGSRKRPAKGADAQQRPDSRPDSRADVRPGPRADKADMPRRGREGLASRKTAASILERVLEKRVPLDALLDEHHGIPHFRDLDARDRALVRAIVGAVLRHRGELEAALDRCIEHKLPANAEALRILLMVGAAQILFLDVPDHAAVSIAVTVAAENRRTRDARGLVNGVLRRIARERELLAGRTDAARLNTPDWLFASWTEAYGEDTATAIATAHAQQPGLDLTPKRDAEAVAAAVEGVVLSTGTVRLAETRRVSLLPGFAEGDWWVQDAAAALPARLLGDVAGLHVADLCAAPGGKTAELAAAGADVTAIDLSENRLKRLAQNLDRLGLSATLKAADVLAYEPEAPFDAILLDAPCSATGTIRRHPDVAWLKTPEDVATLSALQAKMLDRVAGWVKPGGRLVFCTCSLEPQEGEAHIEPFLRAHPEFRLEPVLPAEVGGLAHVVTGSGTLRTLPCHDAGTANAEPGMDGFFAARFVRQG
nr:16S rRNA (cytosine(967)-C(5))-methyltransferase RsmB [Faunimonas pinastri]